MQTKVRYTLNSGKWFYLRLKNPHQGEFAALIPLKYPGDFADDPQNLYRLGDEVTITGEINSNQDDPSIYITDPVQIEVIQENE
jgi:hypothetical protein